MGQRGTTTILQCIEGLGVLVIFQQRNIRVLLAEIRIGRGALVHQQRLAFQFVHRLDGRLGGRDHTQRHLHVGRGEVHHAGAFLRLREVGQNDVHLAGFQILDPVSCLGDHVFHLVGAAQQILGKVLGNFHIEALALAFAVDVAKGRLVAKHADADTVAGLDPCQPVISRHRMASTHHTGRQQGGHQYRLECKFHDVFPFQVVSDTYHSDSRHGSDRPCHSNSRHDAVRPCPTTSIVHAPFRARTSPECRTSDRHTPSAISLRHRPCLQ